MGTKMNDKDFTKFYSDNYKPLVSRIYKITHNMDDAEELVQEAFTDFYQTWNPELYGIKPLTLLYKVLNRRLVDAYRSRACEIPIDFNSSYLQNITYDRNINIEKDFLTNEENIEQTVIEEIEMLPSLYRDILKKYYFDGMTHEEIACELIKKRPNITTMIQSGERLLKSRLIKRGIK